MASAIPPPIKPILKSEAPQHHKVTEKSRIHEIVAKAFFSSFTEAAEKWWYQVSKSRVKVQGWVVDHGPEGRVRGLQVPTEQPKHIITIPSKEGVEEQWKNWLFQDVKAAIVANDYDNLLTYVDELHDLFIVLFTKGIMNKDAQVQQEAESVKKIFIKANTALGGMRKEKEAALANEISGLKKRGQHIDSLKEVLSLKNDLTAFKTKLEQYLALLPFRLQTIDAVNGWYNLIDAIQGDLVGATLDAALKSSNLVLLESTWQVVRSLWGEIEARKEHLFAEKKEFLAQFDEALTVSDQKQAEKRISEIDKAINELLHMQSMVSTKLDARSKSLAQVIEAIPKSEPRKAKVEKLQSTVQKVHAQRTLAA